MNQITPPLAARKPHEVSVHNVKRNDPYHWLRADNWQEVMQQPETLDPEIRAYLDAENAYYEARVRRAHRGAAGNDLQGNSRPHQGRR